MEILYQAKADTEEVITIEIDPKLARNKMITANNHVFMDRRVELFGSLINKH
jgi:hypothetical protein